MIFIRTDDHADDGGVRVTYSFQNDIMLLSIVATKHGMTISGETGVFTDYVPVTQALSWAYQQYQHIRDNGFAIPQRQIDRFMPLTGPVDGIF